MTTLYEDGLALLRERKVYFAEQFIPYFFSSYACHAFNLRNYLGTIYFEHGIVPDLRLHLLMVAPPGYSKSFFMKQCFDQNIGILNTQGIQTVFEGSCTEAGWVGTVDKFGTKQVGLAEEYASGVVSIEEFTAITKVLQQQHSLTFEAQLNSSLFGGEVRKRLATGKIKYQTYVTLVAGTQVTKFDITGGLLRRLNYIYWIPTRYESEELKKAIKEGENVALNKTALNDYRNRITKFQKDLNKIKKVTFSDEVYKSMAPRPHFEFLIFRKLALGYNLFNLENDKVPENLEVVMDKRLKNLMEKAMEWRDELLGDPECALVLRILSAHAGKMKRKDLLTELIHYSVNWQTASIMLEKLKYMGKVKINMNGEIEIV